jgi:hypothetical protein
MTKIWIGAGLLEPGFGLPYYSFVIDLSFFYPLSSFLGYPLCCSSCTSVSFLSFQSIDDRLALRFISLAPPCSSRICSHFYNTASLSYSHKFLKTHLFAASLGHEFQHASGLLRKTNKYNYLANVNVLYAVIVLSKSRTPSPTDTKTASSQDLLVIATR